MKEQFLDDIGLEELIGYIKKYVKDDQDVKPYASYSVFPKTGEQNIIYIDTTNNLTYYWDDTSKTYKALDVQTWDNLSGKPSTFPPSTHNHDDRYYTETEINTKLAGKANSSHTHKKADITDFPTSMPASDVKAWAKADAKPSYSKSEVGLGNVDNTADKDKSVKYATSAGAASSVDWSGVKNKPGTYPPSAHNHNIESLTNFNARVYDAAGTRAANTVLAAPSDSDGTARFRKLVAADLPSHTHNYAGSASAGGAAARGARGRQAARRELRRRRHRHPGRRGPYDAAGRRGRLRGQRYLQVGRPGPTSRGHRKGHHELQRS